LGVTIEVACNCLALTPHQICKCFTITVIKACVCAALNNQQYTPHIFSIYYQCRSMYPVKISVLQYAYPAYISVPQHAYPACASLPQCACPVYNHHTVHHAPLQCVLADQAAYLTTSLRIAMPCILAQSPAQCQHFAAGRRRALSCTRSPA